MKPIHCLFAATATATAACCLVFAAASAHAQTSTALIAQTLSTAEQAEVDGMSVYKTPANHPFRMAALVNIAAYGLATSPKQVVKRSSGAASAVYSGLVSGYSASTPPLLPTWPSDSTLYTGTERSNLAQGWATMTDTGVPYLYLQGYGDFSSEGTAAWTTTVMVPAGNVSQQVVLRLVIPPATVDGLTDRSAVALWRSRIRAELLVNGYPAWSSEASRFNVDPSTVSGQVSETLLLEKFGKPLSFPTNDDDAGSSNDSLTAGAIAQASEKKTVYLSLGRFQPGATLELAMILRGTAHTKPRYVNGVTHRCQGLEAGHYACSRGTLTLKGEGAADAPRVYLMP